jgi:hypothetical protein
MKWNIISWLVVIILAMFILGAMINPPYDGMANGLLKLGNQIDCTHISYSFMIPQFYRKYYIRQVIALLSNIDSAK